MPETRFDDIVKIEIQNKSYIEYDIDELYCHVCEINTIEAISYTTPEPALCGVKVQNGKIIVKFAQQSLLPEYIIVKLSGIRKGRQNRRFFKRTKEEMLKNIAFWSSWKDQKIK